MATATLTGTPTIIDDAESTSNWGGDSFALETDIKVAGNNSVVCALTSPGANDIYVSGSWDFSSDVHLRLWVNTTLTPYLESFANNGIQIFLYDGTNTAYWTVGGNDTYAGGWKQFVLYTGETPTSGTVTKSSVTRIGMRFNNASRPKNVDNTWLDQWTYGDGYTVTGGSSGDPITWSDIAIADAAYAYGIVSEIDDVIFLAGNIKIGNGATTTYFLDNQICMFKDLLVSTSLYQILFQGSGCHVDVSGGAYSAAGTQDYVLDASDTSLASLVLKGKQVSHAGLIYFAAGESIQNNVFDSCLQIDPSTSTFKNNTISNSVDTGGAVLYPSDDSNISDLTFLNNDNGIEYDSNSDPSSPTFVNMVFDDVSGKYDVNNTSGGAATINLSGTSNANSYTGSQVTFSASYVFTITGLELNTEVTIVTHDTSTVLFHEENATTSDGSGKYKVSYTHSGGATVDVLIHHIDYKPDISNIIGLTLPYSNSSAQVSMFSDENYYNP
jgi:hypothetical protein